MKTYKQSIFFILFLFFFVGCKEEKQSHVIVMQEDIKNLNPYQDYIIAPDLTKRYDYYEISNDVIVTKMPDMSYTNLLQYINTDAPTYTNTLYEKDTNYTLQNNTLDINETLDALIVYGYDTLTKVKVKEIYKKGIGLYSIEKNFCVINSEAKNCQAYMYLVQ
ncbi:hypothetical protein MNB_SM-3-194 [hydrothermal vent metagenome]|uniref:Lipoprotein n=1 Tax=hydrothermal vent metagenome TaxID=652676 RepID=A0A1W1D2W1_9ZZZZ